MKCRRCGAVMPDGLLRCSKCGADIRIVPDYNPLDDVLAAQVKGAIDGSEAPLDDYEYEDERQKRRRDDRSGRTSYLNEGTAVRRNTGKTGKTGNMRNSGNMRSSGNMRNSPGIAGRTYGGTGRRPMTPEERRRQAERKRARKRKKRIRALIIFAFIAVFAAVIGVVLYQFSYKGQVRKGYKYLQSREYHEAEEYFQTAVNKKPKRAEAYKGLTEVYLAQDNTEKAETMLLDAVEKYPDSAPVYEACFFFYTSVKKEGEIPLLLDEARIDVANKLSEYSAEVPEFSLDDEDSFEDVQQLSLESSEKTIYYTTDGSDPFYSDTRTEYKDSIQIPEGETVVKAVSVNKKKIPSLTVTKTYTVELPIEAAPAVSPSTGQYDEPKEITIVVPDGYTAYYTMDNTDPTENSEIYSGPVSMPEGSTIFKAVLINGKGKLSGITTRNYERTAN